jgi:hypothetical protein
LNPYFKTTHKQSTQNFWNGIFSTPNIMVIWSWIRYWRFLNTICNSYTAMTWSYRVTGISFEPYVMVMLPWLDYKGLVCENKAHN